MSGRLLQGLVVLSLFVLTFCFVAFADDSDPTPPARVDNLGSERFNESNYPSQSQNAEAGNITELFIFGVSPTETWHGFFGDISGAITLDDLNNNTLYNWSAAEPQGRIYAANSSVVNWSSIRCFNYTAIGQEINLSMIETMFGIADYDYDGINETFGNGSLPGSGGLDAGFPHPSFVTGIVPIGTGSCPATTTFQSDAQLGSHFIEVMLTDTRTIVFATIIENRTTDEFTDIVGFDGVAHDFQMLVLDDGHLGDTAVTPWFFFVELE